MIAAGIDIGGTKIEAQVFNADWQQVTRHRSDTPGAYAEFLDAIADTVAWIEEQAGGVPVGLGSAGLVNPETGVALTANLPATGHPLVADVAAKVGRSLPFINDCRALTLSEAVFGAGKGANPVVGLILGTGVGGGAAADGRLSPGPRDLGGEFGHLPAPAHIVVRENLPVLTCGCGRSGCIETLISGPGLARIAEAKTGTKLAPEDIAARRADAPEIAAVWAIWCALVADLLMTITLTIDPEVIVIGGGLSRIDGLADDLTKALKSTQFKGYSVPELRLAQGGDASGARGAALHAWREAQDG